MIVCPKRVVVEFLTQAEQHLHMKVTYVRTMADVMICPTDIMVTNYERVRDGEDGVRIDPSYFTATSLDEASVLRGFGTKTYQEFRCSCVLAGSPAATPSPNKIQGTRLICLASWCDGHRTGSYSILSARQHEGE